MNTSAEQPSEIQPRVARVLTTGLTFEKAEAEERAYWLAKSPIERLAALEMLRQMNYGYDPATARLPRFFEILER